MYVLRRQLSRVFMTFLAFILVFSGSSFLFPNTGYVDDFQVQAAESEIPENALRIHYQTDDGDYTNLGLWTWDDVESPTDNWPTGGIPFVEEQMTDYGVYLDIPLKSGARNVGFLVLDVTTGAKDEAGERGGDKRLEMFSPHINEVWIQEGSDDISLYEPVELGEDVVRIHYKKADGNYENLGLWLWGDVKVASGDAGEWPSAATPFTNEQVGKYGAYLDIELNEGAEEIGILAVNRETGDQEMDREFTNLSSANQLFIVEGDDGVYTNPYGAVATELLAAELLSDTKMVLSFTRTDELTEEGLLEGLTIENVAGELVSFHEIQFLEDGKSVELNGEFPLEQSPYTVTFEEKTVTTKVGWRMLDEMYAYDGELGATLHGDGTATIKIWSPKAESVSVVLYDKEDQNTVITELEMILGERGVWQIDLDQQNTGLAHLNGYYYHYEIERDGEKKLALDPYAKSLAAWNNAGDDPIAKAAIVDPATIGPELDFAQIDGFEKKEDAIIYEVHVRDFTSDPNIADELSAQFGTFASFVEKLDYIEELGVTHIQLLPVMSYFFANEFENDVRMLEYASTNTNYNWGYDPQSYFSLTGMYSENPEDPELRIEEFKQLIDEIHDRGMGVILDVVYNHTARVSIFEDLVPNYYHFMDADGTPRESFGGGRLGTTHEMARRVLVDSIMYWVEEFKVDGFRFDMMGDHDAETIQMAYDKAKELNPNIVMIGEGWITYVGDEDDTNVQAADQHWMQYTDSVGVFSDEFRNELKSGFGSEGQPMFITGGARNIDLIFDNIKAQPHNFVADDPGDVVPYIEAHDNLTLHDVIAQSIQKDPEFHQEEIHQRIRLGNLMVLTSQGTAFLHAGQEFGRTKQFRAETAGAPYKSTYMTDEEGNPFTYPYFIHDSYDSTDIINRFDWEQATDEAEYPINNLTREYTTGLIELRKSSDAFRLGTKELVDSHVTKVEAPEIEEQDLVIAYRNEATNEDAYYVFVNADTTERILTLEDDLTEGIVVVDQVQAGTTEIVEPVGVEITADSIKIEPLTAVVVKVGDVEVTDPPETPEPPVDPKDPEDDPIEEEEPPVKEENGTEEDDEKESDTTTPTPEKEEQKRGEGLPNTATSLYNYLAIGAALLLAGAGLYWVRRRKLN
ncbi:alkaline amylopullulanase [Alkalihalobacillus alcalophilus ATCC 27647 = CGMCC 1.3604]|uniref:pullulanase n=2 Tax=Alkalihalobacillus alcalophilus ATCC 27647 = CGMCC 1.3604 TaxID=1218173 RepID=A0A4S4K0X4_ALKAL|nr:alkaline amylopullulanase [Alkalihalobacillus alcalophilus ATCC 27647 = CGMCC 1.3604]